MADETAPKTKRVFDTLTGLWCSIVEEQEKPVEKPKKVAKKKKKK